MKTVSLELAKPLKEAGFPQDTQFLVGKDHNGVTLVYNKPFKDYFRNKNWYRSIGSRDDLYEDDIIGASPTADEILDLLPEFVKNDNWFLEIYKDSSVNTRKSEGWLVRYTDERVPMIGFNEGTLADAAAKMWLYLKENDLLGVK